MKLEAWTMSGQRVTADEAAAQHKQGDRYIDQRTGLWLQLHIDRKGMVRNHFEFMRDQDQSD